MRNARKALLEMAGISAMLSLGGMSDRPLTQKNYYRPNSSNGHTWWGAEHSNKTKRKRAKERAAKKARKINWK